MYQISKEFNFSASHQLVGLCDGHPCGRLHGHNYKVNVVLRSDELNEVGFVFDFGDLSPINRWINETLDHRHLNDVMPTSPTSENLAKFIFNKCGELLPGVPVFEVGVSETPKTWAVYRA